MKTFIFFIFTCLLSNPCLSQFAPQVGLQGTSAIAKDSNIILSWASNCIIHRGWIDIADTTLGKTSQGDSLSALGMADANIVSLGDGGEAILYFENPITNGNGFDFAIFENGFRNPIDSNEAFLELATVAVSNDGINYYSFNAVCNQDTLSQIPGAGVYLDARKINNLAGKYITYYGTPFDLDELGMILALDINNIHYIKIKDVVGSLNKQFCTRDINNHIINEPYPTPYPTGGFDLDAVAVIHQKYPTGVEQTYQSTNIQLYPNPVNDFLYIVDFAPFTHYRLFTSTGQLLKKELIAKCIETHTLKSGLYWIELESKQGNKQVFRFVKQ